MISVVDRKLLNKIFLYFTSKNLSIATAESCTGGLIANTLTDLSGSSAYFDRGIVSYSNRAKIELLGISERMLVRYGAVSEQVARAMADGIRKISKVDIGMSTTGIAGPSGGSSDKPVGLVFIGISTEKRTVVKKFNFTGNRSENKISTCEAALSLLFNVVKDIGVLS